MEEINKYSQKREELFRQIFGRLRGKNLPKNMYLIEGNPDDTWLKTRYKGDTLAPGILFLEGSTYENRENLPKGYIERMELEFSPDSVDRYIIGNWDKTS